MSETQAKLKALVAEKITALKTKIGSAESIDQKFSTYETYDTFFNGLEAGVTLAGGSEDDARPVKVALTHIKTQLDALEAEADLDDALA